MNFEEQIMSKDKYLHIFCPKWRLLSVFIILNKFTYFSWQLLVPVLRRNSFLREKGEENCEL